MDTATLVNEQIDEGKLFVNHLRHNGFPVEAAFWVLTSEDELWFLYLASNIVDVDGLAAAYRKVYAELARCRVRWISRSDIKLVGSQNPIAQDAISYRSDRLATRYGGRQLGKMFVEEAYIYPNSTAN
ncbi:MAG TPA: hypothetical protein VMM76_24395 [Pirellulaceae bacterium]|nr:hypothetical protein [Pirellulaceae bacterium]